MDQVGHNGMYDMVLLKASIEKLSGAVERQTTAINNLPDKQTISTLTEKIDMFMTLHRNSLPIFMVILMFATLLGAIFGKEIIEWIFNHPINPSAR